MAAGFIVKKILMTRETTPGVIPTNPVCIQMLSESFGITETQSSEDINLLATGGDASAAAFGTSTFSGSIGLIASVDNAPIMATHIAGLPLTTADASADAWAATTVYAIGDIVNHSDGKHSMTCTIAGTSGATEPTTIVGGAAIATNPNDDRNKKVVDGTVTWVLTPLLKKYTFERKTHMPSFTVEYELENALSETFYKRFSNVYMNTMPVMLSGSTISMKTAGDFIAAKSVDSESADWDENLSAKDGAVIVPQFKEYYIYEDARVKMDNILLCETDSINCDITRNVTVTDAVNNCKIVDIGTTSAKGNFSKVFETADYVSFKEHNVFALTFDCTKPNGCQFKVDFPLVQPKLADPALSVDKQSMLSSEITAYGEDGIQSFSMTIIAPALVDDAGNIVGTYA